MKKKNKSFIIIGIVICSILSASIYFVKDDENTKKVKPQKYIYTPINYFIADSIFEKELQEFLKVEKPNFRMKEYMVFIEIHRNKCKLFYTYDAHNIAEKSNIFFFKYNNKIMAASYMANDDIVISKEYIWSVLKDVFPSQYQLYQQRHKKTADTIIGNIWYLTFRYVYPNQKVKRVIKQEKAW